MSSVNPRVVGIGGIFFRARDPEKLAAWYQEHLGIAPAGGGELWQTSQGIVVFAPFKKDTAYFPAEQPVMVNFRVQDIDALLAELKAKGVRIDEKRQDEDYGRFAWVYDGEGNKIELWEPIGG
ncbi:MAG: VOC family protein [Spirochaetes bacterium]|nr:VOC family protein [Spirochaetota bacterium]